MKSDKDLYEAVHRLSLTDQGVADAAGVDRTTALHWRRKVRKKEDLKINPKARKNLEAFLADQPSDYQRGYDDAVAEMRGFLDSLALKRSIKPSPKPSTGPASSNPDDEDLGTVQISQSDAPKNPEQNKGRSG